MKKNIFSVIITALTVINVVLTAILFFVMLPTFNKTNNLITQVASVLNLELDADSESDPSADYSFSDQEPVAVKFETQQTYNLKMDTDNKERFAMLKGYTIYLNSKADDYEDLQEKITANQSQITNVVTSVIQGHTYTEATQDLVEKESLEKIAELLDSKIVVKIDLDGFVKQ